MTRYRNRNTGRRVDVGHVTVAVVLVAAALLFGWFWWLALS